MDLEPIRLAAGAHPDSPDGCLMEWVALYAGLPKTDRPPCVNHVITCAAIHLNDALDDGSRQRLRRFIPTLLRTPRSPADDRIGVRLAIWSATRMAEAVPERLRSLHRRAVEAAAAHLDGRADESTCRAAAAAAAEMGAKHRCIALYVAADAADAACADDPYGGTMNAVGGALQWALYHADPVEWFAGLLAAHAAAWELEVGADAVALPVEEAVCSPG